MLTSRLDGSGPPLLLLNGGLMSMGAWEPLLAPLTARFRVIRCDFRGQLLTPGPFPSTLEEHAGDVLELLDHLAIDRANLLGASFGGEVALLAAAMAPHRFETLTILTSTDRVTESMWRDSEPLRAAAQSAAAGADGGEVFRILAPTTFSPAWLARLPHDFVEQRAKQIALLPREFFAGLSALLAVLAKVDLTPHLGRIKAPTLIIAAQNDRVFPLDHSRALAKGIEGARLEIIPEAGHGAILEQMPRVLELVLGFAGAAHQAR